MAFWVVGRSADADPLRGDGDGDDVAAAYDYGTTPGAYGTYGTSDYKYGNGKRRAPAGSTTTTTTTSSSCGRGPKRPPLARGSVHVKNLAFLVIREHLQQQVELEVSPVLSPQSCESRRFDPSLSPHRPPPSPVLVERTQSGHSIISSDTSAVSSSASSASSALLLTDLAAAALVRRHVATTSTSTRHARILRSLIRPPHHRAASSSPSSSSSSSYPLDDAALLSLFSSANALFFAGRLSRRVAWDWSHPASPQYKRHVVGSTALRRCEALGGYETLIVLSSPILRDGRYDRRLLISAFLHEMIHSFLFISCGFGAEARLCGGHTEGFRQIAEVVDRWVGGETLRLRDVEADLERFVEDEEGGRRRMEAPRTYRGHPGWEWHDGERSAFA